MVNSIDVSSAGYQHCRLQLGGGNAYTIRDIIILTHISDKIWRIRMKVNFLVELLCGPRSSILPRHPPCFFKRDFMPTNFSRGA